MRLRSSARGRTGWRLGKEPLGLTRPRATGPSCGLPGHLEAAVDDFAPGSARFVEGAGEVASDVCLGGLGAVEGDHVVCAGDGELVDAHQREGAAEVEAGGVALSGELELADVGKEVAAIKNTSGGTAPTMKACPSQLLSIRLRRFAATALLTVAACGDDGGSSDTDLDFLTDSSFESSFPTFTGTGDSSPSSDTDWETSGFTSPPTGPDPTTGPDPSTGTGPGTGSTGSGSEAGSSSETGSESTSTGSDLLPGGMQCNSDAECQGFCYMNPILGGICGDCLEDADCAWGCNAPNPLRNPPTGATCGTGGQGEGCETSQACMGDLSCSQIIDAAGFLDVSTCGECSDDDDCPGLCSPNIALAEFGGSWSCVAAGSLPDGATCDLEGSGSAACTNGFCAAASIMGFIELGVCSACLDDGDCSSGTCLPPQASLDGRVVAGTCSR